MGILHCPIFKSIIFAISLNHVLFSLLLEEDVLDCLDRLGKTLERIDALLTEEYKPSLKYSRKKKKQLSTYDAVVSDLVDSKTSAFFKKLKI